MIFVSSACVKNKFIGESVGQLAEAGYKNIELSGGTQLYDNLEIDLLQLQKEYNLNYICHNYFPPPRVPFVVNLASLNDELHDLSIHHLQKSIGLSSRLGAARFGFHAGFLINIPLDEIGKSIAGKKLFDKKNARDRFVKSFNELKSISSVKLYVENNVVSSTNYKNFGNVNPFFMTDSKEVLSFKQEIDFGLILDVAHLKVSCKTLGLNFEENLDELVPLSDYIHISDNDGLSDSNRPFYEDSTLFDQLKKYTFAGKIITLEVYGTLEEVLKSYATAEKLF